MNKELKNLLQKRLDIHKKDPNPPAYLEDIKALLKEEGKNKQG